MRNFLLVTFMLALFASPGWCISISDTNAGTDNGTDVGSLDIFIISGPKLNGEAAETDWVNSVLSPETVTWEVKTEPVNYFYTDETNTFAFALSGAADPVEYFLVKNAQYVALYRNLVNVNWGVFSANSLPADMNIPDYDDGFVISHVTEFQGDPTPQVPEPTTMLLFGTGLACLTGVIRKKRK
ncbi:PEP-CTERM sorting domain-containing protein [Desulfogranum marinum]|uniref:PEP-CTERM sorting domain-containing protein n=1 Tax=Desulfogranum marinum TaxID=453220 RepID=UPI0029C60E55|nr:PEP-CTERM sorting domain-containing protein [Desulfogranum marinum]